MAVEMMMEASFDTEESFDDPSCFAPQPPGSVSPAKRQIKEVKETKTTVSTSATSPPPPSSLTFHHFFFGLLISGNPFSSPYIKYHMIVI